MQLLKATASLTLAFLLLTFPSFANEPTPVLAKWTVELLNNSNGIRSESHSVNGLETSSIRGNFFGGVSIGILRTVAHPFGFSLDLSAFNKNFEGGLVNARFAPAAGKESITLATLRASALVRLFLRPEICLGVGPYGSAFAGNLDTTDRDGLKISEAFPTATLDRAEFGIVSSVRGEAPLSEDVGLTLDARYYYGVSNLLKATNGDSAKTRDIQVGLGVAVRY